MLNSGATHTYIDEDIAFDLHLKQVSNPRVQKIGGFFGSGLAKTWKVELTLTSHDGMLKHTFFPSTKRDLTVKTGVVDWNKYKKNFDFMNLSHYPRTPGSQSLRVEIKRISLSASMAHHEAVGRGTPLSTAVSSAGLVLDHPSSYQKMLPNKLIN